MYMKVELSDCTPSRGAPVLIKDPCGGRVVAYSYHLVVASHEVQDPDEEVFSP
jgi:hypothetical protein